MSLRGNWALEVSFVLGTATHSLQLEDDGGQLSGRYRTQYGEQDLSGEVDGDGHVRLRSAVSYQACGAGYAFTGQVSGDRMEGELHLGEYWTASWTAARS